MKKQPPRLSVFAAGVLFTLLLSACAGSPPAKTPPADEIAQQIIKTGEFDELIKLEGERLYLQYDRLDRDLVADAAVYVCSSGAFVDEVCVIRAKSPDDVEAVKEAIDSRLTDLHAKFVDYVPGEIPKLDAAVVETNGDYVMMTTSVGGAKAAAEFKKMFQ